MELRFEREPRSWVSSAPVPRWLLLLCSGLGPVGCWSGRSLPATGPRIDAVEIVGADSVDTDKLLDGLATRASPSWPLVALSGEYEYLDEALLERDLERVERFYRSRGFYEAKVVGARVIWTASDRVRVQIVVSEGPPVHIAPAGAGRISVQ